ncbi:MAG: hypothetical protein KDE55_06345 [Novosphingobium sp.]|nr:hypothetical protein [Novosphingobium sp.]
MSITLTYHGYRPREDTGARVDARRAQQGDSIAVLAGQVSAALPQTGLYRVKCAAACLVRFGELEPANAAGGEHWDTSDKEIVFLEAGTKIAVDAA